MQLFDYSSKLQIVKEMIDNGKKVMPTLKEQNALYLNAYNLITDFTKEIVSSPLTLGQRITMLYNITNAPVTTQVTSYISKHNKSPEFKDITTNMFYSNIFCKMLDAYTICERDTESLNKLLDVMHHNIYLYDLNYPGFILEYPNILKKIYQNNLEDALKDVCEVLGTGFNTSVEITSVLAKLLTYLSAALELPDVYLYSKKLNLDLSIMKKDYFVASGIIKDLEYMNYKTNDMKYYKALIKQKSSNNMIQQYKCH